MRWHSRQQLQDTTRCAFQLSSGGLVSSNGPDLAAAAHDGLETSMTHICITYMIITTHSNVDDGLIVHLLAWAVQGKYSC